MIKGYLMECMGVEWHEINIYSQLFGCYSLKIFFVVCNSTLPPRGSYRFDNQWIISGGIMGGIRVELHVIPP